MSDSVVALASAGVLSALVTGVSVFVFLVGVPTLRPKGHWPAVTGGFLLGTVAGVIACFFPVALKEFVPLAVPGDIFVAVIAIAAAGLAYLGVVHTVDDIRQRHRLDIIIKSFTDTHEYRTQTMMRISGLSQGFKETRFSGTHDLNDMQIIVPRAQRLNKILAENFPIFDIRSLTAHEVSLIRSLRQSLNDAHNLCVQPQIFGSNSTAKTDFEKIEGHISRAIAYYFELRLSFSSRSENILDEVVTLRRRLGFEPSTR